MNEERINKAIIDVIENGKTQTEVTRGLSVEEKLALASKLLAILETVTEKPEANTRPN